ncbi:LPXTG cell wall anchor domain-containing protein [Streptomyces sp. NPDC087901]|uniref:LPXTG cell wall anchor domain-containing protein n=1 Tax=Streptomyces sp. NPDC087901 TaxID=3365818 RepID=UPI00382178EB
MTDRGSDEAADGFPGAETGGRRHRGGPGTLPLVAAGAALVAFGGALVVARRRKRA